ncbi:hypothetical protein N9H68_04500, partial [Planktomarina temperata]|nr:hypothetical protein [Planktomarina temperata]
SIWRPAKHGAMCTYKVALPVSTSFCLTVPAVEARPDWRLRDRNEQSSASGLIVPKRAVF